MKMSRAILNEQAEKAAELPAFYSARFIYSFFHVYVCACMPAEARKGHQSLGTGAVSNYVGDGN